MPIFKIGNLVINYVLMECMVSSLDIYCGGHLVITCSTRSPQAGSTLDSGGHLVGSPHVVSRHLLWWTPGHLL